MITSTVNQLLYAVAATLTLLAAAFIVGVVKWSLRRHHDHHQGDEEGQESR